MKNDLKIIKRKYGEKMMHLVRELFPTLLEQEGLLSSLMLKFFEPNRELYDDIINNKLEVEFKNFIYTQVDVENGNRMITTKTPEELMEEAGYHLYLCKNEDDIQRFKKYYAKGEELCTFTGRRLERCYVFFAVRHDVDKIKREDFKTPKREDRYGTSVISIQFDRDYTHNLSIKNRYNHHVNDPDATFSNNLENIIEGLTDSFARYYGLEQKYRHYNFQIPGYILAHDGKYYKYNFELYNTYYCPNNVIIENGEVKKYDKAKYLVFDYFILKLDGEKKIFLANDLINDYFIKSVGDIKDAKIEITNQEDGKKIVITKKDSSNIILLLDKNNSLISYQNDNVKEIGSKFLCWAYSLRKLSLKNVEIIGDSFLYGNRILEELDLSSVRRIGNDFLYYNDELKSLSLPSVEIIGEYMLTNNQALTKLDLPSLVKVDSLLLFNKNEITLNAPNLKIVRKVNSENLRGQMIEIIKNNRKRGKRK